jgi:hypothetical protein
MNIASRLKDFFFKEPVQSDGEILVKQLKRFMNSRELLTPESFNSALQSTTHIDDGLTPVDNYMSTFLSDNACFKDKNLLALQMDEYRSVRKNSINLHDANGRIADLNTALETEVLDYENILQELRKDKKSNKPFSFFPKRLD